MVRSASLTRSATTRVTIYAALSRCIVVFTSIAAQSIIGSYDTSAELNNESSYMQVSSPLATNFDAEYFGKIAREGYLLEQMHAFWPLLPMLVRALDIVLGEIVIRMHVFSEAALRFFAMTILPIILSNLCFVFAARSLYRLSLTILEGNQEVAMRSALLFCFTPAGVFMSAFYTESLFALLCFTGRFSMVQTGHQYLHIRSFKLPKAEATFNAPLKGTICILLATLTRSNGLVYAFNFPYLSLLRILPAFLEGKETPAFEMLKETMWTILKFLLAVVVPYAVFQGYGYISFCLHTHSRSPWCDDSFPIIYAYVQSHYWNNGLLRYWELKQLPNFALATPITLMNGDMLSQFFFGKHPCFSRSLLVLPFVLHLWALNILCLLYMHVQVLTRFVSSCPALYWYAAISLNLKKGNRKTYAILNFFFIYTLLGTSMFACYYPWS